MEKKLYFRFIKVDDNLIDLFFNSPEVTKEAYMAIRRFLGEEDCEGIMLIAKPNWAILLDKYKGAWITWMNKMMSFVNDDFASTEGRYYLKVIEGNLVPCKAEYLPMTMESNHNNLPALT